MKYQSVWEKEQSEYPELKGDIERDIVVIGGGIAGFLTAFHLAEKGKEVALIEADKLFSGTTGKTTAKISCNQGNVYSELYKHYGKKAASLYYRSQREGMQGYVSLVQKYGIECDFHETDGYIFSRGESRRLKETCRVMREIGAECEEVEGIDCFKAVYALKEGKQYLFDPIKFLTSLPVNFEVYEHTRAVNIDAEDKVIQTNEGRIWAEKIIVATHFPIVISHGKYFMKLRQSTSYTIAVSGQYAQEMYLDEEEDGLSLRPYANGTLLGGGDHRTGRSKRRGHFERLEKSARELFGGDNVTHRWCAEDVMTFDGMPMVGKYAKNLDDVYVVTGFNKWGMANAMICAQILTDMILGEKNAYAEIFSPQRKMKGVFGSFMSNALENAKGIFLGYCRIPLKTASDVPKGSGMVVWHNGKRRAVYRGKDNKLYVIGNKCPHMHCELKWNGDTDTWDCPCHGSRFDIHGNILSEPSTKSCKCNKESKKDA